MSFVLTASPFPAKKSFVYRRILVPIDGSPAAVRAVEEATRLARAMNSQIRLLHVIDELSIAQAGYARNGPADLRAEATRLVDRSIDLVRHADVEVDSVLYNEWDGTVSSLVADEARRWHADLVVAGTHGRRDLGEVLLGSSAERILRGSSVPVMLVHATANESAALTA